ncbi:MAG: transketolase family protein [Prevotellaceae bacterium]|jgi:transketolase|nr:transketolase family protein [Prevotellaceae bacterium]
MKSRYEEYFLHLMADNNKIIALFADSDFGKYDDLKKNFNGCYFNLGIAECNVVGIAAGLAKEGFIPVVYAVNSFIAYRAYEFIRNICIQRLNVKFVGMGAGVIINNFGPTHHTTEDIAILRVLPNMTLLSPASPNEVPPIVDKAIAHNGPVYIRLGKAFETEIYVDHIPSFEIGKSTLIQSGNDLTIITTGSIISNVIEAAKLLAKEGVKTEIINMTTLKPLDVEAILQSAKKTGKVLTVEEHQIIGGLGGAVSEVLCTEKANVTFRKIGFNDIFCTDYGWHRDLKQMYGLSPIHIFEKCREML